MKTIKKYLNIYRVLFRNSLMSQMEYRFNFIVGSIVQLAFMLVKATYAIVIQSVGIPIAGISPDEMLIFIGTYSALSGVYMTFYYMNFINISHLVRTGELDMMITKPVSTQFMASLGRVYVGYALVSVPIGGVMIVYGWLRAGIPADFVHIASYLSLTALGMLLAYFLFLIPAVLTFWLVSGDGMFRIMDMLWDFNNMPMIIYNEAIQFIGLFLLPIFAVTNLGSLAALDRMTPTLWIWAILAPLIVAAIQRTLWKKAMRHYSSASS